MQLQCMAALPGFYATGPYVHVHANYHIIKAYRGEETLMGRNDRYNLI